jgi:hypothetical protein
LTEFANIGDALRAAFGVLLSDSDQFVDNTVKAAVTVAGEEVQAKAIELAPVRTGELEGSSELTVTEGRAEIVFGVDYAAEAHELPESAVGPGTAAKPGNELGPAGPKFLERPLLAMEAGRFLEIAGEELAEHLDVEVG